MSLLDDLKKKAGNIAKAGYNGVNIFDDGRGYTSQAPRPVATPNVANAKYGKLANNPQAQQQFQQSIQPNHFNPVTSGLQSFAASPVVLARQGVNDVVKPFVGGVANTAKLPVVAGQIALHQKTGQDLRNTYNNSLVGAIATPALRVGHALAQTPLSPTYGIQKKLEGKIDAANKNLDQINAQKSQQIQQAIASGQLDRNTGAQMLSQLGQINTLPGRQVQALQEDKIRNAGFNVGDSGFTMGRKFASNAAQTYLNAVALEAATGAGAVENTGVKGILGRDLTPNLVSNDTLIGQLINRGHLGGVNMSAANVASALGADNVNLKNIPADVLKGYLSGASLAPVFNPGLVGKALAKGADDVIHPKYAGLTKNQIIMDPAKLNILNEAKDVLDTMYKRGEAPTTQQAQRVIDGLHQIRNDHGLDFITGNNNERVQKINQFLEQNGEAIPKFQKSLSGQEGGFVQLPGKNLEKQLDGLKKQLDTAKTPAARDALYRKMDKVAGELETKRQEGVFKKLQDERSPFKETTGTPSVDRILENKETAADGSSLQDYYRKAKGVDWSVKKMSPDEYLERAAKAMGKKTPQEIREWIDSPMGNPKEYAEAMKRGDKFPMPWLDEVAGGQEGRTRALAAKLNGETEIPVAYGAKAELQKDVAKYAPKKRSTFEDHTSVTDKPLKVYRGEGKGIGNATLTNGRYFADSKEFAANFGKVSESEIPKGSKVFDFDRIKEDPNQNIIPHEILMNPEATRQFLLDRGITITKNTNTRGVEYVQLGENSPAIQAALKSKTYGDFQKELLNNWDKYRADINEAQNSLPEGAQVTGHYDGRQALWDKAQEVKEARTLVDKYSKKPVAAPAKKPLPSQDTKSIKREIAELDRKIEAFTEDSPAKQSLIDRQMKLVDELNQKNQGGYIAPGQMLADLKKRFMKLHGDEGGGKNAPKNQAEADAMFGKEGRFSKGEKTYKTVHEGGKVKDVQGEPVKIVKDVDTFMHKDENGNWVVSEATTGRNLTNGGYPTQKHALDAAKANINQVGEAKFRQMLKDNQLEPTAKTPPTQKTPKQSPAPVQPEPKAAQSRVVSSEGSVAPKVSKNSLTEGGKRNQQNLSRETKKLISGEHNVRNTKELGERGQTAVDKLDIQGAIDQAHERMAVKPGKISDEDVSFVSRALERADAEGRPNDASALHDALSEHLVANGQTSQAASLLYQRSPQGILYKALRDLKKAGVAETPEMKAKLQGLTDAIKAAKNPLEKIDAVARMHQEVSKLMPQDISDQLMSVWKAGLLSGVKTQSGNALSNGSFAGLKASSDPLSAAYDKGISLITKKRTKTATQKGFGSGFVEGTKKGAKTLRTGIDERNMNGGKYEQHAELNFKNPVMQKVFGVTSNMVFRGMNAADQPWYYAAVKKNMYDLAKADGLNKGLHGAELKTHMENMVANPTMKMAETAKAAGDKATLNYDTIGSKAVQGIHKGIDSMVGEKYELGRKVAHGTVNALAPFVRVPTAYLSRSLDYTPVGAIKAITHASYDKLKGRSFDQRALSEALGEATTGTAVIFLGAALASKGLVSGQQPQDQKEAARWKAEHITPNSIKIGDKWVSQNYLGPAGILIGAGKDYHDASAKGDNATMATIAGAGKNLTGQSFLSGFSGFSNAIQDPQRNAKSFVNSEAGSIVPSWLNDVANSTDSWQRQANTPLDTIKSRVPEVRKSLDKKQDVYGNDLKQRTDPLNLFFNPLRPSDSVKGNPVIDEVSRLHVVDTENKDLQVTPTPVDKTVSVEGTKVKLNDKQRYTLQKKVGQDTQKNWNTLINTSEYKGLTDIEKANALTKLRQDTAAMATRTFVVENNLGEYNKLPTKKQIGLATGEINIADYAKKPTTKTTTKSTTKKAKTGSIGKVTTAKKLSTAKKSTGTGRKSFSNQSTINSIGTLNRKIANLKVKKANFRATTNKSKLVSYKKPKSQKISVTKKQLSRRTA